MAQSIAAQLCSLLQIPSKLENIVSAYVVSLCLDAPKHTQEFAAFISGIGQSSFSRLLRSHARLAISSLDNLAAQIGAAWAPHRPLLVPNTQWTIGIIVDSTLHRRSSRHVHNGQRFNHGGGFVVGHQWTNVVIVMGDMLIPLPPIAFLTKNECKRRKIAYQTEHELIIDYIEQINLVQYVGLHRPEEVVVLSDSGYDNKKIQRSILKKKWDFISNLKSTRSVKCYKTPNFAYKKVRELFKANKRNAPWESVRVTTTSKKKQKRFCMRELLGWLKGIDTPVKLLLSKREKGDGNLFLACSNSTISARSIVIGYSLRWKIEIFHRDVKNNLGFEDAGVENFESLQSHVHWVYCAYLLLKNRGGARRSGGPPTIAQAQDGITREWEQKKYKHIVQISTRFGGSNQVQKYCSEVIRSLRSA